MEVYSLSICRHSQCFRSSPKQERPDVPVQDSQAGGVPLYFQVGRLFCSIKCPNWWDEAPPHLGRAICCTQSPDSPVHLIQKHHKRWIKFHQMCKHLGPCTPWPSWYIKLTITGTSCFISICVQIKTMHSLLFISLLLPTDIHELLFHAKVYVFLYSTHSCSLSEKTLFPSFTILAEERIITLSFPLKDMFEKIWWVDYVFCSAKCSKLLACQ